MRHVHHDWEFLENGRTVEPLSVAMLDDSGREYYAIFQEREDNWSGVICRAIEHQFLREHVLPYLPIIINNSWPEETWRWRYDRQHPDFVHVKPRNQIRDEVLDFLTGGQERPDLRLWAWFGAYDHLCLAQLFGSMMDMPGSIPFKTNELVQLWEDAGEPTKPPKPANAHDPRADVRWNDDVFTLCRKILRDGGYVIR